MTREQIEDIAYKIKQQRQKLQQLQNAGFFTRLFKLPKAQNQLARLMNEFDAGLHKFLLENDAQFQDLARQNLELLENNRVIYKVASYTFHPVSTYSAYFKGHIDSQGYAHCYVSRSNVGVYPMAKYDYVSKFLGTINYLGEIELKAVRINSALIFSLPRKYTGKVNNKGIIELSVVRKDIEIFSGRVIMNKLIAKHFEDPQKSQIFNQNRQTLKNILKDYRQRLLEE